jgi:hypothetical protein
MKPSRKYEIWDSQNIIDESEILHEYYVTSIGNIWQRLEGMHYLYLNDQAVLEEKLWPLLLYHLTLNVKTLKSIKMLLVLGCLIVNMR